MSISAGSPARSIRGDGDVLVVGGESHSAGASKATPERFVALEAFAREHWDVARVTHRWSAQDPSHYDHLPVIGPYRPGSSRLWVTAGFMKWGFSSATFGAVLLADHINGRRNEWAATFTPNRVSPRSLHEIGRARRQVHRRLRRRPGQAARHRHGRRTCPAARPASSDPAVTAPGVYRDDDGQVHAVSLRCTHMGCLLRFNSAELSWDCPCHGSRFDVDGAVLEGPAVHDLERREL